MKRNNQQFEFFCPIYIDGTDDIPNKFVIHVTIDNGIYKTNKQIEIPLRENSDLNDMTNWTIICYIICIITFQLLTKNVFI